ncbi:TCP-1/cpn60 chaperonin family protein [Candidatus Micrarchaeota archaeon]|nr:TCP-1/cpn60 chaperonin family protein [Candidatus Micrarchaeota archaeon]
MTVEDQQMGMLPEGSKRILGRSAQRLNILIGYAVANTIKTTLGPKGMDKMLVSDLGDIVITNDGATILDEMNVEHPAAKIMVEIAKTQDKEVGDGTTTSVVLAGYLLKNAGELLDQGIHPSSITNGYLLAAKKSGELLNKLAHKVSIEDKEKLNKIAGISMGSKSIGLGDSKDYLSELVVDAITMVAEKKPDGNYVVDTDLIKLEKKEGGSIKDTKHVKGVVIDKEFVHSGMAKTISNGKIALLECPLEIEKTETDAKIQITSPDQMKAFLDQEEKMLRDMVEKIKNKGANVVFCQKGIDELAQHFLAKAKISAVRRVKKSDLEKLARATGARIVSSLDDLAEEDLGKAGKIHEEKISGESMVFIEECESAKAVTLFLRASTEHVVNEVERAIVDAMGAVSSAIEDGSYVTGGGSIEIELANELRTYANEVGGREQLAVQAFAEALEIIPKTLAESTGMDAIDTLVALRTGHTKGEKSLGVSVHAGKNEDMEKLGVIEPTRVKKQAISSATEAATMVLRIDDIIASKGKSGGPQMPPGGMGGMGDM